MSDALKQIKADLKEQREKELKERMKNGVIQLKLFNDERLPFFSQGLVEKTIFLPNSSRKKSYELIRNEKYSISIGRVENVEHGTLKTRHRDVMFALLRLWADSGWSTATTTNNKGIITSQVGYIETTPHELLSLILKKRPGKNNYKILKDVLWDLKSIPIRLYNLEEDEAEKIFSLIHSFDYDKQRDSGKIKIYLNEELTKNYYQKKEIKKYFLETLKELNSDIAKTIFLLIDKNLTHMNEYSIKVDTLCEQAGLTVYPYNSEYRKKWKKALDELNKINLTDGRNVVVSLQKNKNKELIFHAKVSKKQTVI